MTMKLLMMTSSLCLYTGLVSLGVLWNSDRVYAQERRFSCGQIQGSPATLAATKRGQVPVIRWTSDYFAGSGWTPAARCRRVSDLFEQYYRQGTLNFLTTERDRHTQQNVVCVAPAANEQCTGVLFTLKPESNPGQTLKQLLDLRTRATNNPLNETYERVYISMDEFLENQPVVSPVEGRVTDPQVIPSPEQPIW